jgi:uncharacterized protein YbjT (DUF2867 family)
MAGQTAVVIGATGMIGELVVRQLINDADFTKVRLLVRKVVPYRDRKVEVEIVDFKNKEEIRQKLGQGDCIICCVGTTQAKVKGDKAAYRKIDFDIPVDVAKAGLANGFHNFLIVSAIGANAGSGNFYLQLKGETEDALKQLQYPSLHIFQPSVLMGHRKESRPMEKILQAIMPAFSIFLAGKLKKYKPIEGQTVAKAMVNASKLNHHGTQVYSFEQMSKLATS